MHSVIQWCVERMAPRQPGPEGLLELEQLVAQVRQGEASIEELGRIDGPLAALAGSIADILRDLRCQQAENAQLQAEMRQRVAQRTDALERVIGSLRHQASRDSLTGLYNRRFLEQELPSLIERAWQRRGKLCLLMLDLDNFKTLNDSLGHAAGDELLRSVGQIIRSTIREQDLGFRFGGDEFVILLPEHGEAAARSLSQRLVSLIGELGRSLKTPLPLGLSSGWATLGELTEPRPEILLAEADKRLYQAKAQRKQAA